MPVPVTQVRTSHALTIRAAGQVIGLINSWNPSQSRTLTPIFELGVDDSGNPVEHMPGNISGLTISVNRYDTYPRRMEQVFGTPDLAMLTRQSEPFDIVETWSILDGDLSLIRIANPETQQVSPSISKEQFIYRGCWFSNLGRTLSSEDNRVVNTNATLVYTKKLKAQGPFGDLVSAVSQFSF